MDNKQTNLLILASGAGTRNALFTYNNALPKCLMSVGDRTCIEAIVDSYKDRVDKVYIALQNRHAQLVDDILKFKGYTNYVIVSYEPTASPMASVTEAFKQILGYEYANWFLNWSDVFVNKMVEQFDGATIICDKQYRHRNLAYVHKPDNHSNFSECTVATTSDSKGNVAGIFYVDGKDIQKILATNDTSVDFDVLLSKTCQCSIHYMANIVDIGDYAKYSEYMRSIKQDNVCRYFNELEVCSDCIKKRPKTEQGRKLHKIEFDYYRKFSGKAKALARLLGYDTTTMTMSLEKIKGKTCQSLVDTKGTQKAKVSEVNKLIAEFNEAIATFHNLPLLDVLDTPEEQHDAIINEFSTMIDKRVQPCAQLIDAVLHDNGVKTVDGMPISTYDNMKQAVDKWIAEKFQTNFFDMAITHGDPNTDNTLYCASGVKTGIRFVDPRGYFGKLKTLGLGVKNYDLAKFVYGFSGYGRFNSAEYIAMQIENDNINFYVGANEDTGITDVSLFDMKIDDDIRILVGIIWVKLTSYIINDPMKSVAAYLHGNALLTKLLNIPTL
jgi:hypothetical protein